MKVLRHSLLLLVMLAMNVFVSCNDVAPEALTPKQEISLGESQLSSGNYKEAASLFWGAIMRNDNSLSLIELKNALELFLISYKKRDIPEEGFLQIGQQFIMQGLIKEGTNYLTTALSLNPKLIEAYLVLMKIKSSPPTVRLQHIIKALELDPLGYSTHFEVGSELFSLGSWDSSLAVFEKAFQINNTCWQSLSSLVYLRTHVCKWGNFGAQHSHDMAAIEQIIEEEVRIKEEQKKVKVTSPTLLSTSGQFRGGGSSLLSYGAVPPSSDYVEHDLASMTASSVHAHVLLGYPISSELKLKVARMHTEHEQSLVRRSGLPVHLHVPEMYAEEAAKPDFRIKIGYVSANFRSKTTVYMAQDLFRFHDRNKFEVHVYATTPNDSEEVLESTMAGVSWRKKVKAGVEHFHEVHHMDLVAVSRLIQEHGIHILLDWDGHSNNLVRLSGLFPMHTSPLQIAHQEFIGSTGASYIQYLITDKVTSPSSLQHLYSEKFIYMPNTFLANSMAYLSPHISPPELRRSSVYDEKEGGGDKSRPNNPALNGCGGAPADFVYCNFNKHLKFSPEVFRSWLTILQNVENSLLCLLHNPQDSEKYLMEFINDFDESLASRVRFLPFVPSPFDNQKRVGKMCHVSLDTPIYNGHTSSVDALWGGVPVVVYGNTVEMASRVGMSMMSTLRLPELIATDQDDYNEIAIRLADDEAWYRSVRRRLVQTCYENNPMNPLWDLAQYVKDLEVGYELIWENFLSGNAAQNADIAAYKRHVLNGTSPKGAGEWMRRTSKTIKTKKRNSLKPLLQSIKQRKGPRRQGHGGLQASLGVITQGLRDVLGDLDSTIEVATLKQEDREVGELA